MVKLRLVKAFSDVRRFSYQCSDEVEARNVKFQQMAKCPLFLVRKYSFFLILVVNHCLLYVQKLHRETTSVYLQHYFTECFLCYGPLVVLLFPKIVL